MWHPFLEVRDFFPRPFWKGNCDDISILLVNVETQDLKTPQHIRCTVLIIFKGLAWYNGRFFIFQFFLVSQENIFDPSPFVLERCDVLSKCHMRNLQDFSPIVPVRVLLKPRGKPLALSLLPLTDSLMLRSLLFILSCTVSTTIKAMKIEPDSQCSREEDKQIRKLRGT